MDIQWYPGHMTKARRMMQENIKLIDIVIELLDARVPLSSKNPEIDQLAKGKSRLLVLNKADMADRTLTPEFEQYFQEQGYYVLSLDSRNRKSVRAVSDVVLAACSQKIARDQKKGIKNRPVRAMVVGIPNVGKSTFINTYAGKSVAKTGNKPGVTKGKQWITLGKNIELLDTPGILWPKIEEEAVGYKLAMIGSINDDILDMGELSYQLVSLLVRKYPGVLASYYHISEGKDSFDIIQEIAIARNYKKKGNEPDVARAEKMILNDFRGTRIGKLTLDEVPGGGRT